ncbi:nuclear transport factor 2 family protein [Nakamurella sp. GG22]
MTQQAAVAEAFCRHRFSEAYPQLADDVRWVMVGGATLTGKQEVIAACERTLEELTAVTTRFRRFRVIEAADSVVVDSISEYREPSGVLSVVASCDIFDFTDGRITEITSYTVELTEPAAAE